MYKYRLVLLLFVCTFSKSYSQKSINNRLIPYKIGIAFNTGNEKSFLFDDPDYYYSSISIKGQLFYPLTNYKGIQIDFLIQPQIHFIEHQLINEQFITPDIPNYLEIRARFTKLKRITLSAVEFGVDLKKEMTSKTSIFLRFGVGLAFIDIETERLASGFTFVENGSIGISYRLSTKFIVDLGIGVGHVSNFDFQQPNSGYTTFDMGIGFQYFLK